MTVDYVTMGRSGLKVSRVCLGAMNFGAAWGFGIDDAQARPIINAYLDAGHNFIDTAGNYNDGQSEEIVSRAVRGRRDSVVIATKGFMPQGPGPNDRGLSRVHLTRALDASLRRLGTDYVDLYQCHFPDPDTPIEETIATLDGFVRSGRVRYLGCSNFTASQMVEAQWAAERIDATPAAVALAWVRNRPGVTSVIIGPRTVEQLQQNLTAFELKLPPELVSRLDEASGPAPAPVTGVTVRM